MTKGRVTLPSEIGCWGSETADPSASLGMTKGRVGLPSEIGCWGSETADPSASLGMTKGRVGLPSEIGCWGSETADPSAPPDFLSRVTASVNRMWFSLRRTTYVVVAESGEVGNPGTLGMTKERMVISGRSGREDGQRKFPVKCRRTRHNHLRARRSPDPGQRV